MVTCEMCGKEGNISRVSVEGTSMAVCDSCKSMGKSSEDYSSNNSHTFRKRTKTQVKDEVVVNFSSLINSSMAKKGFTAHQLARVINIKESSLNKYLSGKIKPDIDVARKIENFLEIKIVEQVEGSEQIDTTDIIVDSDDTTGLSLGDLIKKQLEK